MPPSPKAIPTATATSIPNPATTRTEVAAPTPTRTVAPPPTRTPTSPSTPAAALPSTPTATANRQPSRQRRRWRHQPPLLLRYLPQPRLQRGFRSLPTPGPVSTPVGGLHWRRAFPSDDQRAQREHRSHRYDRPQWDSPGRTRWSASTES